MTRWCWVAVLFILGLSLVVAQSGGGDEDPFEFCYSSVRINQVSLTCELDDDLIEEVTDIKLCEAQKSNCTTLRMIKKNITFRNLNIFLLYNIEVHFKRKEMFKTSYYMKDIIKPDPPRITNATFLDSRNQAIIVIENGYDKDYLQEKLKFNIRIKNGTTVKNYEIQVAILTIEGLHLKEDTVYYVQARTHPKGNYFHGSWSDWCTSNHFRTPKGLTRPHSKLSLWVLLIISVLLVLFMILVLATVKWHNEIISVIWPSIPNPKNTLVQAYKPKKGPPVSFNPETFIDSNIHLIDRVEETRAVPEISDRSDISDFWGHSSSQACTGPILRSSCVNLGESQPILQNKDKGEEAEPDTDKLSPTVGIPGNQGLSARSSGNSDGAKSMPVLRREEAYVTMSNFYKSQ